MNRTLKTAIEYWDYLDIFNWNNQFGPVWLYDDYMNFLKQPLQLWMFIPCDKEGKPLEKPEPIGEYQSIIQDVEYRKEYQQAQDRVIFEGFEIVSATDYFIELKDGEDDYQWIAYDIKNNSFTDYWDDILKTVESLSGKVDLVEKVAEKYKYRTS